jgi:hypothetical protein
MAQQFPFRAPVEAPIADKSGALTGDWSIHMQLTAQQLKTPANQPAPATARQPGQHGQTSVSGGFYYVYDATVANPDGTVGRWLKLAPVAF